MMGTRVNDTLLTTDRQKCYTSVKLTNTQGDDVLCRYQHVDRVVLHLDLVYTFSVMKSQPRGTEVQTVVLLCNSRTIVQPLKNSKCHFTIIQTSIART